MCPILMCVGQFQSDFVLVEGARRELSSAPRLTSSSATASTASSSISTVSGACGGGGGTGGHQGTPSSCGRGIAEGSGGHGGDPAGGAAPGSLEISQRGHPAPGPALPGHRQVRVGSSRVPLLSCQNTQTEK